MNTERPCTRCAVAEGRLTKALWLVVILNLCDAFATWYWVSTGAATEANPWPNRPSSCRRRSTEPLALSTSSAPVSPPDSDCRSRFEGHQRNLTRWT